MPIVVRQTNVCDVCRLLDGDYSQKICRFCKLCDSWICMDDLSNWLRRARAAWKRKSEPTFSGDPEYRTGTEFDEVTSGSSKLPSSIA